MKTSVSVTGSQFEISGAILLYRQNLDSVYGRQSNAFATIHAVSTDQQRPQIEAGRPMTEEDFASLVAQLAPKSRPQVEWQDHSVLAKGLGRMIWWTPPMKRAMFFSASKHNTRSFKGQAMCPVPGMVWQATGTSLYVYAFEGDGMPTQETPLFQAPLFNVWASGQVCHGNAVAPVDGKKGETGEWEKFLFGSRFTHPNFTEKDRLILGEDPAMFWKKMVTKPLKSFPVKKLVKIGLKVGDLLAPDFTARASKMTAQGEF